MSFLSFFLVFGGIYRKSLFSPHCLMHDRRLHTQLFLFCNGEIAYIKIGRHVIFDAVKQEILLCTEMSMREDALGDIVDVDAAIAFSLIRSLLARATRNKNC